METNRLKFYREKNKLTRPILAKLLDVEIEKIILWEENIFLIEKDKINSIISILGISKEELFVPLNKTKLIYLKTPHHHQINMTLKVNTILFFSIGYLLLISFVYTIINKLPYLFHLKIGDSKIFNLFKLNFFDMLIGSVSIITLFFSLSNGLIWFFLLHFKIINKVRRKYEK